MFVSVSRTYSNPATVANLIRVNGLDAVRRTGLVPAQVLSSVCSTINRAALDGHRVMLADRWRSKGTWRMVRFARRHGVEAIMSAEMRPYPARIGGALIDAWVERIGRGEIGRRHGWDVAHVISKMDRDAMLENALSMGIDVELIAHQRCQTMEEAASPPFLARIYASKRVMRRTCRLFGVTYAQMMSRTRVREVAVARHFFCYWLRRVTAVRCPVSGVVISQMSYPAIGRRLGGRDHTTVLHSEGCWINARSEARKLIKAARQRERLL